MHLSPHQKEAVSRYIEAIRNDTSPTAAIDHCRWVVTHILQCICIIDLKINPDSIAFKEARRTVMEAQFFSTKDPYTNKWKPKSEILETIRLKINAVLDARNEFYNPANPARALKDVADISIELKNSAKTILKWYFTYNNKFQLSNIENLSSEEKKEIEHLFNIENIAADKDKEKTIAKDIYQRKEKDEGVETRGKTKPQINRNIYWLYGGLLIIAIGLAVYILLKSNNKPQNSALPDSTKHNPPIDTPITIKETNKPPAEVKTEVIKKEEEPIVNTPQISTSKYILNDEFKNKEGSNEMSILIINSNNSTNGTISQKIASVFLKNMGYNNTASLLSNQFVTDGLFEKIYNGEQNDLAKLKFSDYADYFCLGKLSIETNQSDLRTDMTKATISLEIKVVKTTNGGEIISLTIPAPYNIGVGFSKQEAIEVATDNIISYLKKYKYEN